MTEVPNHNVLFIQAYRLSLFAKVFSLKFKLLPCYRPKVTLLLQRSQFSFYRLDFI